MVLIKRFVTCIYTYHEANSSLDHYSYKSQLIGGMLLHIQKLYFIEVSNQICGIPKQPNSQWVYYVAPSKDKFTF